jgi:osmotically-inducible protein OsmY
MPELSARAAIDRSIKFAKTERDHPMSFATKLSKAAILLALATSSLGMVSCAVFEDRQTTGEYVDDATISTKVRTEIIKDENLKLSQINVETFKGTVQLTGFVDSAAKSARAAQVAAAVSGVKQVKNDIIVKN